MPRAVGRKEHPLSMRLPDADISIIDRAAALRGRSRTEFVRDAAVRAAEATLLENAPRRIVLQSALQGARLRRNGASRHEPTRAP